MNVSGGEWEREAQREREREGEIGGEGELLDWTVLRCPAPVMAGNSEKVPIASAGPEDLQQFMPPVSAGEAHTAGPAERRGVI